MTLIVRTTALLTIGALLSACSSDSGSVSVPPRSFESLSNEAIGLVEGIETLPVTTPGQLPASGSATYDGVMALQTSSGGALAGDLALGVDFGRTNGGITGSVTNVVDAGEVNYDGSLRISGGVLDRGADANLEPVFTAGMDGTLVHPDSTRYEVDGALEGAFIGGGADYAGGLVTGQACASFGCEGFDGAFIARD